MQSLQETVYYVNIQNLERTTLKKMERGQMDGQIDKYIDRWINI